MCSMNFTQITQKVSLRKAHQAAVSEIPLATRRNDVCFSKSGTSRKNHPLYRTLKRRFFLASSGYKAHNVVNHGKPNAINHINHPIKQPDWGH
jgi:hypothetical protein